MAGFGISTKDIESVSISVPAVGTYQLPISDLISSISSKNDGETDAQKVVREKNHKKLKKLDVLSPYIMGYAKQNCSNKKPLLLLVSEVYAAHDLKVDINLSAAAAANLKAAFNISDSKSKLDLINAYGNIFGIPPQNPTSDKPEDSANQPPKDGKAAGAPNPTKGGG